MGYNPDDYDPRSYRRWRIRILKVFRDGALLLGINGSWFARPVLCSGIHPDDLKDYLLHLGEEGTRVIHLSMIREPEILLTLPLEEIGKECLTDTQEPNAPSKLT